MTSISVLLLGLGLGFRHATDPDHVVVVTALVQKQPGVWKAARVAALWGAGHTITFLVLGLLIILAGLRPPPGFEESADLLVALMLVGFGLWHLASSFRSRDNQTLSKTSLSVRPVAIGLIHGLAGSAGVALLAATTIESDALAVVYLGLVALGTVCGMALLTVAMSRPIGWTMRKAGFLRAGMTVAAAVLSIALGVSVLLGS